MKSTFLDLLVHLIREGKILRKIRLYLRNKVKLRELAILVLFLHNHILTFVIVESQEVHHFRYFKQSYNMCDVRLNN